jgi:CopG family nickel-responsive transcriptional regulator
MLLRSLEEAEGSMQRITITIDDALLEAVDVLKAKRGYDSRSEAFRDILRDMLDRESAAKSDSACVATLSYVFDYETRDLAQRLARAQHDHHDLVAANMRVPLDHNSCLELSVLRGAAPAVQAYADAVTTQRGVRHANLHVVPVTVTADRHRHGPHAHLHEHVRA